MMSDFVMTERSVALIRARLLQVAPSDEAMMAIAAELSRIGAQVTSDLEVAFGSAIDAEEASAA